jgi:hypothetical protein
MLYLALKNLTLRTCQPWNQRLTGHFEIWDFNHPALTGPIMTRADDALGLVMVFSLIAHAAVATLQGSAALPPIHYSFFQSFKCTVTGADDFLGLAHAARVVFKKKGRACARLIHSRWIEWHFLFFSFIARKFSTSFFSTFQVHDDGADGAHGFAMVHSLIAVMNLRGSAGSLGLQKSEKSSSETQPLKFATKAKWESALLAPGQGRITWHVIGGDVVEPCRRSGASRTGRESPDKRPWTCSGFLFDRACCSCDFTGLCCVATNSLFIFSIFQVHSDGSRRFPWTRGGHVLVWFIQDGLNDIFFFFLFIARKISTSFFSTFQVHDDGADSTHGFAMVHSLIAVMNLRGSAGSFGLQKSEKGSLEIQPLKFATKAKWESALLAPGQGRITWHVIGGDVVDPCRRSGASRTGRDHMTYNELVATQDFWWQNVFRQPYHEDWWDDACP